MNLANKVVPNPKKAISVKDHCNPKASAIKPIMGGPTKNPRNPILDTAAKAIPGDSLVDLPAWLYSNGTTDETPNPTNRNPIVAMIKLGNKTAIKRPIAITMPLA